MVRAIIPAISFSSFVSATRWVETSGSVAQNRNPIGQLEDLFEPMRDVDDGDTLAP